MTENLDPTLLLPNPLEVIESIAFRSDPAAHLQSFQPNQPQFEALRKKLIELRGGSEANSEELAVQIPEGPALKLGVEDEQVALLRKRLDPAPGPKSQRVRRGRARRCAGVPTRPQHEPGRRGGPGTRRLLNHPHLRHAGSPSQTKAILVNMGRSRLPPHDLGAFYVAVNVPEFMLRVVKEGDTIHTARVVVGKPDKPTPIIQREMREVFFGPFWNVPDSIKTEEIRPYLRPETSWFGGGGWNISILERHDLRVRYDGREFDPSTINWGHVDILTLQFYQPPGPANVLGRVKFVFPNKHDVYLHDTPQKYLFANQVRAESHGCMRVQNADQLAAVILKHDQNWSAACTESAFDTGYDEHVALRHKVPVYITYFTYRVNTDGSVSTFNDIYGHDARMAAALRL
jgi:murein L,D-transpeptidase YcbB/YkuD